MRIRIRVQVLAAATIGLALACGDSLRAQATVPPLEVAGHVSTVRLGEPGDTNAGFGGRVTVNLAPWFALEAGGSVFPDETFSLPVSPALAPSSRLLHHRRRFEAFAGPKLTLRGDRVGVFVVVRPGVTRARDGGIDCEGPICPLILVARSQYRSELALDAGGGLEIYPSRRTVVRFDVGDLVIRHRSAAPPCRGCTTHNLHSRLGVGVRF